MCVCLAKVCSNMRLMRNARKILVCRGDRPNIKKDLYEIWYGDIDRIYLAQDRIHCDANAETNFKFYITLEI